MFKKPNTTETWIEKKWLHDEVTPSYSSLVLFSLLPFVIFIYFS
jgi:hypothetical protein